MNKPTVSLCLMVKDEANTLARCINSASPWVDEVIVVDTGSQDDTRRIAQNLGARVYPWTWTGNFSEARNFSLGYATGEWILYLDADEILSIPAPEDWFSLLARDEVEGYYLELISYLGQQPGDEVAIDRVVRLFRRRPEHYFTGAIHEQVIDSIFASKGEALVLNCSVKIYHFGYLNQAVAAKNKITRNLTVIKQALRVSPNDPFLYYSMGTEYLLAGNNRIAACIFKKCLKLLNGHEGYQGDVYFKYILSLISAGDYNQALKVLDRLNILSGADYLYLKGLVLLKLGQYYPAIRALQDYLKQDKGENRDTLLGITDSHRIYSALGDGWGSLGNVPLTVGYYLQGYLKSPRYQYPLHKALEILREANKVSIRDNYHQILITILEPFLKALHMLLPLGLKIPASSPLKSVTDSLHQLVDQLSKELIAASEAADSCHDEDKK